MGTTLCNPESHRSLVEAALPRAEHSSVSIYMGYDAQRTCHKAQPRPATSLPFHRIRQQTKRAPASQGSTPKLCFSVAQKVKALLNCSFLAEKALSIYSLQFITHDGQPLQPSRPLISIAEIEQSPKG